MRPFGDGSDGSVLRAAPAGRFSSRPGGWSECVAILRMAATVPQLRRADSLDARMPAGEALSAFFLSDDPREVLAAAAAVAAQSSGRVERAEGFNSRTGKPERGGLMCAQLFGPVDDHRCVCGKLSGPERAGERCDRCGVLCGEKRLRGERWGHIEFPGPLLHPRLVPGIARRLGLDVAGLMALARYEVALTPDGALLEVEHPDPGTAGPELIEARLGPDAAAWLVRLVPVTPPDWRGTRKDPQDLGYARLINRAYRLSRLLELDAPAILIHHERRCGQELFDRLYLAVRAELQARRPIVVAPASPRAEALLQAVYDDPDADAPRRAYAEHLAAAGDLRGEFILRQLASAARSRSPQLERDMLRRNYDRWVAPLAGAVAEGVEFRRGFPAACKAIAGAAARTADPAWATIEHLETDLAELVAAPVLRSLASLVTSYKTLLAVCEADVVLSRVHTLQLRLPRCPPPRAELVTRGDALPALSALTVQLTSPRGALDFAWLDGTPLAQRLTRLTLGLALEHLDALSLPRWFDLLARHPQLSRLELQLGRRSLGFTLRREGPWSTLRVMLSRGLVERICLGHSELATALGRALTALSPHDLLSLQIDGAGWFGEDLEALARSLRAHFGGVLTLPPGA